MKQSAVFFTTKKIHVSFLLAIMIFAIHISSLDNYNLTTPLGSKILFWDSITMLIVNVAVPMFMILSAVMFYRNYSLEKTKDKYISRVKTLVIPYLFWNFVWTMFQYICSYTFISNLKYAYIDDWGNYTNHNAAYVHIIFTGEDAENYYTLSGYAYVGYTEFTEDCECHLFSQKEMNALSSDKKMSPSKFEYAVKKK